MFDINGFIFFDIINIKIRIGTILWLFRPSTDVHDGCMTNNIVIVSKSV